MRLPLILGTSVAAIAIVAAAPLAEQVVGAVTAVKNDVRLRKPGAGLARPVALKQRVAIGDAVQTGPKSQMQLVLLDQSVFTVGANARLTIDRFVYDPARASSLGATVTRGAFRFLSGRRGSSGSAIRTPVATIGVRGTILEGVVGPDAAMIAAKERGVGPNTVSDPETATLIVLRGPGRATQGGARPGAIDVSAGGRTVTADRPLQAIYVPHDGAMPIGPFPISNNGLSQLNAILNPALAQRLGLQGPADNLGTGDDADPATNYQYPTGERPVSRLPGQRPPGDGLDDAPPSFDGPSGIPTIPQAPARRQQPQPQQAAPAPGAMPNRSAAAPAPTPTPAPPGKPVVTDQPQQPPAPYSSPTPSPSPMPTYGKKP